MSARRGHNRERQVRALLEGQGFLVVRAAGSLGDVDLVALKDGHKPMLVEVKSTAGGPYERFGPVARNELAAAAAIAGANAVLCWWPPRRSVRWIWERDWPEAKVVVA